MSKTETTTYQYRRLCWFASAPHGEITAIPDVLTSAAKNGWEMYYYTEIAEKIVALLRKPVSPT